MTYRHALLQHLHEVLTATEAGRDSDINNSMENIMPRIKLIDASLKVCHSDSVLDLQIVRPFSVMQKLWDLVTLKAGLACVHHLMTNLTF